MQLGGSSESGVYRCINLAEVTNDLGAQSNLEQRELSGVGVHWASCR